MCPGEILSAMYTAAQSGVDVRIITPYIADKRLVKACTESYYRLLLENKVRIFEYLPGFIHAKNLVADGKRAMVGTVNLDYRSLYLHYECGICLFDTGESLVTGSSTESNNEEFVNKQNSVIIDIENDFKKTLSRCKEITISDLDNVSPFKRTFQRVSRLFAPFL
jgi:cardiolipin synthase